MTMPDRLKSQHFQNCEQNVNLFGGEYVIRNLYVLVMEEKLENKHPNKADTLRITTHLTKEQALAIAESLLDFATSPVKPELENDGVV